MRHNARSAATPRLGAALFAAALAWLACGGAAADPLRVGKAVVNFGFLPLDFGIAAGLFQREGVAIEPISFTGGAKLHQALTAGSLDIALGGGTDMAFIMKGAPERAIASVTSSPSFLGITVGADTGIRNLDGLKGKKLGVTSPGSLTFWLVQELDRSRGWGDAGATPIVIGGSFAIDAAAIKTKQVDGVLANTGIGYALEEQGIGKLVAPASAYVGEFELFTIFASAQLMDKNADGIRRFLRAWFRSVAAMKQHRDETIAMASKVTGLSPAVEAREYDLLMPQFSSDGRFKPQALERLRGILADLKVVDEPVDFKKLLTERFLDAR